MEHLKDLKILPTDYFEYGGQIERWKGELPTP